MTVLAVNRAKAALPVSYEHAREALENCERVDECKDWADKAAALASYYRQADDETLFKTAMRIKGRAIRRAGELLKEVEPKHIGRPTQEIREGTRPNSPTRKSVAEAAGLSPHQTKEALRVASIPKVHFEELIESDQPPTITALAKQGTKPAPTSSFDYLRGRDPEEFNASIHARGAMSDMAELCKKVSPAVAVRGAAQYDLPKMRTWAETIGDWIAAIQKELAK